MNHNSRSNRGNSKGSSKGNSKGNSRGNHKSKNKRKTIDLDLANPLILNYFIRVIYKSAKIKYVSIVDDGIIQKFYERKNHNNCEPYSEAESGSCDSAFSCEFDDRITTDKPIKYHFSYNPEFEDTIRSNEDPDGEVEEAIANAQVEKIMQSTPFRKIYIRCSKRLVITNCNGINDDHRGSDHTRLILDFHPAVSIKPKHNRIRLADLTDACYRIKSHKFDYWYELYCGIKSHKTSSNTFMATVTYDHGS